MDTLAQIAARYDTDKADHQYYLENYEAYFAAMREGQVRVLELGIKKGGSLLMWRDYFQNGIIVGLDINPAQIDDPTGRVRTYQGPQHDTLLLDRLAGESAPDGFDIVIDDCSHIGVLARASFWHLFENHLKKGGLYVIEDWGTGYWDRWVDGIAYRSRRKQFNYGLYRLTRMIARLRQSAIAERLPFAAAIISKLKAVVLSRQYNSHDYGMVGFVKELVDELSTPDITDPKFGNAPFRASRFRELRMSPSHLFIFKA
jgi:SAM-dependent methyltransferase